MQSMSIEQIKSLEGKELGVSGWKHIDQGMVNAFADLTGDHQFIHVDEKMARMTPLGGTVAHGFLTLSLIAGLMPPTMPVVEGTFMGFNYGLDRLRFLAPVRTGSDVRARYRLVELNEKSPGQFLMRMEVTVEIKGEDKPALVADWLGLHLTRPQQ